MKVRHKKYFVWCLHCERVFKSKKPSREVMECHYPGCDGGLFDMSSWTIDHFPRNGNPQYPEIPEVGKIYPLYPPGTHWSPEFGCNLNNNEKGRAKS